jgi:hypothetical protein
MALVQLTINSYDITSKDFSDLLLCIALLRIKGVKLELIINSKPIDITYNV